MLKKYYVIILYIITYIGSKYFISNLWQIQGILFKFNKVP